MKSIIIFILGLSIFCIPLSAQQVKFGVETGINLSHYKNTNNAQQKGGMGVGFQVGGTVDYQFKHHWMLMSGLSFMQTKSNMELSCYDLTSHFPDTEIKLNHLTIPIKIGYDIHVCKYFDLIPYIGVYGSYDFGAGNCDVTTRPNNVDAAKIDKWKPMDGYSYTIPMEKPYEYTTTIEPFRKWTYGGLGGVKAVIANHYTISFQYYEAIKKAQKQCKLRNYGYQISVGYQF